MIKICVDCNNTFESKRKQHICCSSKCRKRNYYKNNKEYVLELNKNWSDNNLAQSKIYENARRQTIERQKYMADYHRERKKVDPEFKLASTLRSYINSSIKNADSKKDQSTIKLLGCTYKEAKKHIETLFTEDMTWENHGTYGWHIDHIKPIAIFHLTDLNQQKECFNYKNLQPLWAEDNLKKSKKY